MNTNISNAAQAASAYANSYDDIGTSIWFQKYNEKFAELIVKECAEVASNYNGAHYVGTAIEEHFGVEK